MTDIAGDRSKKPHECNEYPGGSGGCVHLRSRETWDTERRWCDVCGERYTLYDDETA